MSAPPTLQPTAGLTSPFDMTMAASAIVASSIAADIGCDPHTHTGVNVLIPIYVIEVRDRQHRPILTSTEYDGLPIRQRLLHGQPTVFVNAEDGLEACIDLEAEYGHRFTYHLVTAGEVEVNYATLPSVFEEYDRDHDRYPVQTLDFAGVTPEASPEVEWDLAEADLNEALGR